MKEVMTEAQIQFPFQNAALDIDQRVEDVLSRMTVQDKAALMFHPVAPVGDFDAKGQWGLPNMRELLDRGITHANIIAGSAARELAEWNNALQNESRKHPLGIPFTVSSDPRNAFSDNPAAAIFGANYSLFPEAIGMAAIGDEALTERFADITRQEYLAMGIRVALHPQIDLPSDARWARQSTTFGSDVDLASRLGVAYIRGLQGEELSASSVAAMVKHFPGGGPQKDGEDPHFPWGREQIYPAGQFEHHLKPFIAAIGAGASQMMPYYGMPVGTEFEEVAFGFNKAILTDLLRDRLGFTGVICSDWAILSSMVWGVEDLAFEDRMVKSVDAGIDQWGGEWRQDVLVDLVDAGRLTEARLDESARRLLREKFRLGLFDNPFVDVEAVDRLVGTPENRELGLYAQASAYTLLKNADGGTAQLPLGPDARVYLEGVESEAFAGRATVVSDPADADVAILRIGAPFEDRSGRHQLSGFFHAGSLEFSAEQIVHVEELAKTVPVLVDIFLERPALLEPIAKSASTLIANFGATPEALIRVLFGDNPPLGNLPFEIPRSTAAIEAGLADVPNDTLDPVYPVGFGLRYP
jgi:beta-glucosidase